MNQFTINFEFRLSKDGALRAIVNVLTEGYSFEYIQRVANKYDVSPDTIYLDNPVKMIDTWELPFSYVENNGLKSLFRNSNVAHVLLDIEDAVTFYDFAPLGTLDHSSLSIRYMLNSDKVLKYLQKEATKRQQPK
jgi:hypothetical protein